MSRMHHIWCMCISNINSSTTTINPYAFTKFILIVQFCTVYRNGNQNFNTKNGLKVKDIQVLSLICPRLSFIVNNKKNAMPHVLVAAHS